MNDNITGKIERLKRDRNAVIIAHNYIKKEVQDVADFVGDSLALAIQANGMDCDVIVFCGPNFMVETAAILNPDRIVLYANPKALCPMAGMCDVEGLREMKNENPGVPVVGYLNTTAKSKTEMDICCTSSNAIEVIRSLDSEKVIFVPDVNLGLYVKRFIPDKELVLWPGYCRVHERFINKEKMTGLMKAHPRAKVLVHPECNPDVINLAHAVLSTDGMVDYVRDSPSREFIIGTEREMIHRLEKECPGRYYHPVTTASCPTMRRIKLEDVLKALETLGTEVALDRGTVLKARSPLERMMTFCESG